MSIRVSNGGEGNFVDSARSNATKATGLEARNSITPNSGLNADQVNLSNASSLVALAKGFASPNTPAKLASLSAQVAAGTYRPDASVVGTAIVSAYTKTR